MQQMHLMAIEYTIIPENYAGKITVRTGLDGSIKNDGVERYSQLASKHLAPDQIGSFSENGIYLAMVTKQSRIKIAQASTLIMNSIGKRLAPNRLNTVKEEEAIYQEFQFDVNRQQKYTLNKNVAIFTSKDKGIEDPIHSAINSVKNCSNFKSLYITNKKEWQHLWQKFDIQVEGHLFSQKALRLHIFHLLETASLHNLELDVGIPARGLSGEAYRGHIFWDELFILPFYNFHLPKITQTSLLYRYRRLEQARKYARKNGFQGAMFPWQSGSTGQEETQTIHLNPKSGKWGPDHSRNQRHISFDIAYNIWDYWKKTKNIKFFINYGAEIFLSIAKFGASLTYYDQNDQRYHTKGLMGPDEFHERLPGASEAGFKDNAYTNLMIVWTLDKARELLSIIPDKKQKLLLKKWTIEQSEVIHWEDITKKMNILFSKKNIISQFDGYFNLKELNFKKYQRKYHNIQRMDRILKAEGKSPNEYKVAKQADTLMLPFLFPLSELKRLIKNLGYSINKKIIKKNYHYYLKRTSHGSTLSKVVHCYLASILGQPTRSWQLYLQVLNSDLNDIQGGTTPEGIHTGVMGGSLYIAIKCYAGIEIIDDIIHIDPNLPQRWQKMHFRIKFKQIWYTLSIEKHRISITLLSDIVKKYTERIKVYHHEYSLHLNQTYIINRKGILRQNE